MMLIFAFTLCLAFSLADYSNHYGKFRPIIRPLPKPVRPILRTTTEQPNNPSIPEMAEVDVEKVQEFFGRFCKFLDARDLDSILNLYADDLVFLKTGKDAAGKEAFKDYVLKLFKENGPCSERLSLISGDYYYPYWWARSYISDGYGGETVHEIFSEVLRLKEDGDYEIVLSNCFTLNTEKQHQDQPTGYGEAVQQPNGYGQPQIQRMEQPKYKIPQRQQLNGYGQPQIQRMEQPKYKIPQRQQLNGYGQAPQQANSYNQGS